MIPCKNCKSINVKVSSLDFARVKREGESAAKAGLPKNQFHCWDCGDEWFSDPEAYKVYFEYCDLKPRTTLVAEMIKPGDMYRVQHVDSNELMRRKELAKILFAKYRSFLELEAGEWYDIELDAKGYL